MLVFTFLLITFEDDLIVPKDLKDLLIKTKIGLYISHVICCSLTWLIDFQILTM